MSSVEAPCAPIPACFCLATEAAAETDRQSAEGWFAGTKQCSGLHEAEEPDGFECPRTPFTA